MINAYCSWSHQLQIITVAKKSRSDELCKNSLGIAIVWIHNVTSKVGGLVLAARENAPQNRRPKHTAQHLSREICEPLKPAVKHKNERKLVLYSVIRQYILNERTV